MLTRAASDSRWTCTALAKLLPFKTCFIHGYKKRKSQGARSDEWGWWDTTTILFLAKNCWTLKAVCVCVGHCHGARTNPHSASFLNVFVAGSHAIFSTHSSKIADLLFFVEVRTPSALSHQHKNNQHCLDTGPNLALFFWSGRIWWLPLTWLLLRVVVVAPTLITCYNFCEKLRTIFEHFLQIMANHEFCSNLYHHQICVGMNTVTHLLAFFF